MPTRNQLRSVSFALIGFVSFAGSLEAAGRSTKEITAEIATVDQEIAHVCVPWQLLDPKYKKSLTPKLIPMLSKRLALYDEWRAATPRPDAALPFLDTRNDAELAYFGDHDAAARLEALAASTDPAKAAAGAVGLGIRDWCDAHGDAAAQAAVLDRIIAIANKRPTDDVVARGLFMFNRQNPASVELAARASDALAAMTTPFALKYKAMPNKIGKPLKVVDTAVDGKRFDSTKWKGKVVVIDFWATWCPPCRAELPSVAALYEKYHPQGLEIIGVSSDQTRKDLTDFLKQHSELAWPQLFASGGAEWHPLTKQYGIQSIPTVYVIDRNGVLRTTEGRGRLEELVPMLLAESAADPTTKPIATASPSRAGY